MKAQEFRDLLPVRLRLCLPEELQAFKHQQKFGLFQLWYTDMAYHFEVAPQPRLGHIEVGLHLEHKQAAHNAALHAAFDRCFVALRHQLGPDLHLEKWDRGWHKLYKTLPHADYSTAQVDQLVAELAHLVTVLQPILAEEVAQLRARR